MKKLLVVVAIVALLGQNAALAGVVAGVLGNNDVLQVRVGVRPLERTEAGLFGGYGDENNLISGGVYGTYDLVEAQEFKIGGFVVPVTWYVGGFLGLADEEQFEDFDETEVVASALSGLYFGDDKITLGVEYQYVFDEGLWSELGDVPDQHEVLFNVKWRF